MLCGAHHRAIHDGRLILEGDAESGWTFHHADGTPYGQVPAPLHVEAAVKVFRGLCSLGFKQSDARRAIDQVTRGSDTHMGTVGTTEGMLRDALRVLTRKPS